jgi:type I restriction enzyme S subunit
MIIDRSGWRRVRFGDVVRNVNENTKNPAEDDIERVVGLDHLDPGSLAITRWATLETETTFTRKFRAGQVLFGKRRAYQRKAAVPAFDGICSGDILVFEAKPGELLPELLPFIVQSEPFVQRALTTSAGSLSPRTKWQDLARYEFELPPLAEQKCIADLLWAVDAHRNTLVHERSTLSALRGAMIDQFLTRSSAVTTPFRDLWVGSPNSGCSAPPTAGATGHHVLSLAALTDNGYRNGQLKNVEPTPKMLAARLQPGDLLISRSNTPEAVGRAAIYPESRDDVSFPDTMMRVRLKAELVSSEFVVAVLMSPRGRQHMRRTAAGTSTSMVKINRTSLGTLGVPLVPLPAQQVFMGEVDRVGESIARVEGLEAESRALASAILDRLLVGQNP